MNTNQIQFLRNWEKRKRVKTGKGMVALSTLTDRLFLSARYNQQQTFHEYISTVHPVLFYYFLGDWSKEKSVDNGPRFWADVNREWLELCWKQKFWSTEGLNVYKTIDELRIALNDMFVNGIGNYTPETALAELIRVQQERNDKKAAALEAERQRAEDVKKLAEAQQNERRIKEESEKLRQATKQQEAEEVAARNRAIASNPNSPWTSSVRTTPKHTNIPAVNTIADFMDAPIDLMDASEPEFLTPKYNHPAANELILLKELGRDKEYNLLEFGVSITSAVCTAAVKDLRFTKDPKDGELIVYFSKKPGIQYSGTVLENGQTYLQVFSKDALNLIKSLYGEDVTRLMLSENISQVEDTVAFKVEDYA